MKIIPWDYPAYGFSGEMVRNEAGKTLFSTRIEGEMENYPKMMGMTFKVGRMARDSSEVVVNETFAEWMHWGSRVVGRTLNLGRNYKVVGLLKDYRMAHRWFVQ